jgi:hypothetical protein
MGVIRMPKASEKLSFAMAVNGKINELIAWVIEKPLCDADFAEARESFRKAAYGINSQKNEPEPSEGGAQYVNVTPAPWP